MKLSLVIMGFFGASGSEGENNFSEGLVGTGSGGAGVVIKDLWVVLFSFGISGLFSVSVLVLSTEGAAGVDSFFEIS